MFGFRLSGEGLFCKGLGQPENGEGRLKSGVQTAFGVTWVVKIMGFASLVGRMLESTAGCQMTTVCLGSSGGFPYGAMSDSRIRPTAAIFIEYIVYFMFEGMFLLLCEISLE